MGGSRPPSTETFRENWSEFTDEWLQVGGYAVGNWTLYTAAGEHFCAVQRPRVFNSGDVAFL